MRIGLERFMVRPRVQRRHLGALLKARLYLINKKKIVHLWNGTHMTAGILIRFSIHPSSRYLHLAPFVDLAMCIMKIECHDKHTIDSVTGFAVNCAATFTLAIAVQ